ncbi:MAG: putative sulfate exporter family transporter [Rubrivivax sp.]|nr:MAG: putative sulfate exporter family transporter [Rubrivivax sp.]
MTPALRWPGIDLKLRALGPGILVATALALAAGWIAGGLGDPIARNPVLVSMLLGLLLGNVFACPDPLRPGLDFTKRYLLRTGIVLLGFRITVALLSDLGLAPILVAAIELVAVLLLVRWVAVRVFRLEPQLALLVAVGCAVCGAAAILSVASMDKRRERHAGVAIALVTLAGTVALLLYPIGFLAGLMPGLDERGFGIAVGASIFEQAQVYGASFAVSEGALSIATLVKLSKVVMLIPLLLVLGVLQRREAVGDERRRLPIPWFVLAFLAVLAFNSMVTVHPQVRAAILQGDQFLFLMVMIALGLTTPLRPLLGGGGLRLIGAGAFALVLSAGVAYALVRVSQCSNAGMPAASGAALPDSRGARLFDAVGCAKCHVPSLRGIHGDVPLYSDLLLHDMGPALDDKIVQGEASGSEWRTTPLIGTRLRDRYLHDGRAASLRDAVLEHGGEAEIVRRRFFELDEDEQRAVHAFVGSL